MFGATWHYTDTFECSILGFVLAFVLKMLYKRWQVYRANKREQKLNGIRTIYRQALENRSVPPSAPIAYNTVLKVTPYTGVTSDIEAIKGK